MRAPMFVTAGDQIIPTTSIRWIDTSALHALRVIIHHADGVAVAEGVPAIEVVYACKPSAFEGKRFRWIRHAWAFHNLIGHPLMQILALLGCHDLAIRVHDGTAPKPVGPRPTSAAS